MTEQALSKMETVDVEKERERFEVAYRSRYGQPLYLRLDENRMYEDEEAQEAFEIWLAAKKQAMEELEPVRLEWRCRSIADGEWTFWSKGSPSFVKGIGASRVAGDYEYQTRTLYAKKGE